MARRGDTLELAVLGLLHENPLHGYELRKQLNLVLGWGRVLSYGSLYPALHRMQEKGWLTTEWRVVDGRRRKYYTLTKFGQEVLGEQAAEWKIFLEQLHALLGKGALGTE